MKLYRFALLSFLIIISTTLFSQAWECLGPFKSTTPLIDTGKMTPHGVGRLHSLVLLDKKGKRMVTSSSTGGTFMTKDYGKNWQSNYNYAFMTGANRIHAFSRKKYWIATCSNHLPTKHWGLGVLETKNRGKNWQATGFEKYPSEFDLCCLYDMKVHPKRKRIVYIVSDSKFWQTKDAGKTWKLLFEDNEGDFRNILISKRNPNLIFISGKKLYKSVDGGNNFREITKNLTLQMPDKIANRITITFGGKKEEMMYSLTLSARPCVLKSSDQGETWDLVNNSAGTYSLHELGIWTFTQNKKEYLFLGGIRGFMSADSGKTIKQVTSPILSKNYVHDDIRDVQITKKGHIYLAHDGGISVSKDLGGNWTSLSGNGLTVTQFYGMSNSEINPYLFYAGTLDMSSKMYRNGEWFCISEIYADGGRARTHPEDTNNVYLSKSGFAYSYDTSRNRWIYAHPFTKRGDFDFPMEFDADGKNFFMVTDQVWRKSDATNTWEQITKGMPASRDISAFAVSPLNPNKIWFARHEQTWSLERLYYKFYRTLDGGESWVDMTSKLPILAWRYVRHLHVDSRNDSVIYAGLGDFDAPDSKESFKIFKSSDDGNTWVNISQGLPNFPINFITTYDDFVFAATDVGVYVLKPDSDTWDIYGYGLPPVVTKEIHVNHKAGKLRAATFGRGLWEVDLPFVQGKQ
jgi:photosystem II stability/assembly factor-like uncharacterized protein